MADIEEGASRRRNVVDRRTSADVHRGLEDVTRRLIRDPNSLSYGAADFTYFLDGDSQSASQNASRENMPSLLNKAKTEQTHHHFDADRAMLMHRSASAAHSRNPSRSESMTFNARDRLHTRTKVGTGPDQAGDFKIIDHMNEDSRFLERVVNESITMQEKVLIMYVVLTVTGVCTGAGMEQCEDFLYWGDYLKWGTDGFIPSLGLAVIYGIISAWLVKRFAPYASGSGIPEIKSVLNGCVMRGYLSSWTLVIKIIGLAFSVSAGLNLGKEGPVVHLACCIAFLASNFFKLFRYNEAAIRDVLACACAAGVAVAFGAPIGGILFAFEEVSTFFPNFVLWRAFYCAAAAALVLKMSNPFFDGSLVMFRVDERVQWYWFELFPIAFIGLSGGFIGYLWIKLNLQWMKTKLRTTRIRRSPVYETIALIVLTISANWVFPFLRETNSAILKTLFRGCVSDEVTNAGEWNNLLCNPANRAELVTILIYGVIQKFFLSALTFGSRVPAGLFIPSLTIGACFGTLVGLVVHAMATTFPGAFIFRECGSSTYCGAGSVYAIIGAGSVLAGVTQVSVSLAVIMLELTDQLNLLLPMMIAIFLAKMVTNLFGTPSIYDSYVHMKRYPYLEPGAIVENESITAAEIMQPKVGLSMKNLEKVYKESKVFGFPIVKDMERKLLVGYISRLELNLALHMAARDDRITPDSIVIFSDVREIDEPLVDEMGQVDLGKFTDLYVPQVWDSTPVSKIYALMQQTGLHYVMVVREGRAVGIISKKDLIAFIDFSEEIPRKYFL